MGIEYASVQVVRKPARAWFTGENLIGAKSMIEFPNHSRSYAKPGEPCGSGGTTARWKRHSS